MTTMTATEARIKLFILLKKSVKGHTPVKITSKVGNAMLVSEEDYENLIETLELLSVPGLLKSVKQARSDRKAGRTKTMAQVFGR
jgi:antitoxin YefM